MAFRAGGLEPKVECSLGGVRPAFVASPFTWQYKVTAQKKESPTRVTTFLVDLAQCVAKFHGPCSPKRDQAFNFAVQSIHAVEGSQVE
jgi:hypothetical protein